MIVATTEQVRAIDRRAQEEYGMPGVVLMENAGRGAAEHALMMLRDRPVVRTLILCGRGNNGGDGFVVGRHLHNHGIEVEFWLACRGGDINPESDAGVNYRIVRGMGLPMTEMAAAADVPADGIPAGCYGLIVDALLGTGLSGEVRQPYRALIEAMNRADAPVLAIDTPSGLDTDTGAILGIAVRAAATVTFAAAKRGFFEGDGPRLTGELHCVSIGCPIKLLEELLGSECR